MLKTQALQWVAPGELNLLGFEEGTLEPRSPRFVQRLLRLESGEETPRSLRGCEGFRTRSRPFGTALLGGHGARPAEGASYGGDAEHGFPGNQ